MRCVPMVLGCLVLAGAAFPVTGAGGGLRGSLGGVVVDGYEDEEGRTYLLVGTGWEMGGTADTVRITLPKKLAAEAMLEGGPQGWALIREGRNIVVSGPTRPLPVHLRIGLGGADPPKRVKIFVESGGRSIIEDTSRKVGSRAPRPVTTAGDGLLEFPPEVFPGEELVLTPLDPALTPPGGTWTIAGRPVREVLQPYRVALHLPGDLELGAPITLGYLDPWGIPVVDAPDVSGVDVVPPPPLAPPFSPEITGASEFAFPGSRFCVCGVFPSEEAWNGLRLDGIPLGTPLTASNTVAMFVLPEEAGAGLHRVTGDPEAGFEPDEGAKVTTLVVSGTIDQETLFRGESTPMRLEVAGTGEPIALRLVNETPSIVQLEGGVRQVVTTSGGTPNALELNVRGIRRGNFNITWELDAPQCPCDTAPSSGPADTGASGEGGGTRVRPTPTPGTEETRPRPTATPTPPVEIADGGEGDDPRDSEPEEPDYCGPDITAAYITAFHRAFRRLEALSDDEKGAWDGMAFLYRNGINIDMRVRPARRPGDEDKVISQSDYFCPRGVCAGNNPIGQKTFMLGGYCLSEHMGNDIMFGFVGAMLDVPFDELTLIAHGHQVISYGGLEPNASRAAYRLGWNVAAHLRKGRELSPAMMGRFVERSFVVLWGGRTVPLLEVMRSEEAWIEQCIPCPATAPGQLSRDFTSSNWSLEDSGVDRP